MSHRPIIDAGPGLNFFSINKERLLIGTLGPLCAPETVRDELLRKSRQDSRFRNVERVWNKLPESYMQVLSDDVTPELAAVVHRITRLPMEERLRQSKDLGETMVIAHAVVAAEAGHNVIVLIDDGPGARVAEAESNRLRLLRDGGAPVGTLRLASTLTVLEKAAGGQYLPDRGAMRTVYDRLRQLDDGLPPLEATNLLSAALWPSQ
ncbi:PIN domain-containing protein [Actinomadura algeriensis]|uniref:Uncharacterized protein n=1 Tax=Actinomadura algeriensis TaxID=1679523 RepID=A0ABR9JTQ2_9ACTN|nr:hypothetical protein [Actinomadura algeriensis]MBE1533949.1 hypothetical protein [Actinomadura algeriensis]